MNNTDTQQRAFNKLNRLKVGALFMECGTGKTKVALDLMASKSRKCDLLLWICPCSLKATIADERAKWQPGLSLEVVGCESIGASSRIYLETLEKVKNAKCAFIVVDESLKIKNIGAKRTQRILNLGELAAYKLILNGTPLTKNALDIYTQITFLSPKILSESLQEFKRKYCEFYLKGDRKGQVKRCVNIPHLVSRIKPYIFDAKLDLNVLKSHSWRHYALSLEEEYLYEKTKNDILDRCTENDKIDFYRLVTKQTKQKVSSVKYTDEHIAWLRANVKGVSYKELTERFNATFGTDLLTGALGSALKRYGLLNGRDARFAKGKAPHNKGKPMPPEVKEKLKSTLFKKGHTLNESPVGSERVSKDGYIEVKFRDNKGLPPGSKGAWELKHRLVWMKHHGEIPKGHAVIFLDGNNRNFNIENLALISRGVHGILNREGLRFNDAELSKTAVKIGELKIKINDKRKKKKE